MKATDLRKGFEHADKEIDSPSLFLERSQLEDATLTELEQLSSRGSLLSASQTLLETDGGHLKEALLTALQDGEVACGDGALFQSVADRVYKGLHHRQTDLSQLCEQL